MTAQPTHRPRLLWVVALLLFLLGPQRIAHAFSCTSDAEYDLVPLDVDGAPEALDAPGHLILFDEDADGVQLNIWLSGDASFVSISTLPGPTGEDP